MGVLDSRELANNVSYVRGQMSPSRILVMMSLPDTNPSLERRELRSGFLVTLLSYEFGGSITVGHSLCGIFCRSSVVGSGWEVPTRTWVTSWCVQVRSTGALQEGGRGPLCSSSGILLKSSVFSSSSWKTLVR